MLFTASTLSLCFIPPENHQASAAQWGRDCFRRVLAAACADDPKLDRVRHEIFWLQPPRDSSPEQPTRFDAEQWDGRPGRPRFVIGTRHGCGVITTLGDEANELLLASLGILRDALHAHWGRRPEVNIDPSHCSLDLFCEEATRYRIENFCIKDRCAARAGFWRQFTDHSPEKAPLTDRAALQRIERRIREGIQEQSQIFGWQLPVDSLRIFSLDATRRSPVNVRGFKRVPRCVVTFQSTFRLTGQWHLGSLISRGYGRVLIDHSPRPKNRQEPPREVRALAHAALV